jgi:hypothetical protein
MISGVGVIHPEIKIIIAIIAGIEKHNTIFIETTLTKKILKGLNYPFDLKQFLNPQSG